MPRTAPIVTVYCAAALLSVAMLALWPAGTQRLLVVVPSSKTAHQLLTSGTHQYAFHLIAGSDARIVDQVSPNSFIIATPENVSAAFVRQLYRDGALLVINAAGDFGCSGIQKTTPFRSEVS